MTPEAIKGVAGYRHLQLGDVASTNDEALARARAGDEGNLWVAARSQSKGRGRRGRTWLSEPGNLYASLLLIDPAPMSRIATLPLTAALAVYRSLLPLTSRSTHALSIKWPNDILLDGAKVNGILLESELLGSGATAVVIGCGINCALHPTDTAYPVTSLLHQGIRVTPGELFKMLAAEMAAILELWQGGDGFSEVRRQWLDAAEGLGRTVTANLAEGSYTGVFEDIDAQGYLLLQQADGSTMRISAGDIFFNHGSGNGQ